MSYDIYGNPLMRGHCEVHPHVHEEYPCSACIQESNNRNAQQQSESEHYEMMRLEHELELSQQRISELEAQLEGMREVTPRMLKAAQLGSELGVIATSKYAGAYDIMTEMYQVMFDAAIKEQGDE